MPESDFLGLIQTEIAEVLTQNGGSMSIFDMLRAVESKYEWVSMMYLNQAVEQSDLLTRQGNTLFLQQEVQLNADVHVGQSVQPLFPGEWQFIDNEDVAEFKRWMEVRFERYLSRNNAKESHATPRSQSAASKVRGALRRRLSEQTKEFVHGRTRTAAEIDSILFNLPLTAVLGSEVCFPRKKGRSICAG